MSPELPARLQFAVTAGIHWMFVLVTLGMLVGLVILQTRALLTVNPRKRELLYRMVRFWGQLYVINYFVGIASGILMEFQFGTNWSGLSHVVGDVFGAPLAVETLVAFVAESTFLAMWIFGWGKIPEWAHCALLWLVAIAAYASAFWVLVANGFMHNPRGYEMEDGRAHLTDVTALLSNPNTLWALAHIVGAALAAGGVVLVFFSAVHLFRRTADQDFFVRSFRLGFLLGLLGIWTVFMTGWGQYHMVLEIQPGKQLEAMLGQDPSVEAGLRERFGPGDYVTPQIAPLFIVMMMIGETGSFVMFLLSPIVIWRLAAKMWWFMPVFWLALPLPFVAAVSGWVFREMGRQPWAIYGVQRTADAVSDVDVGLMWTSFVVFTVLLLGLLVTNWWLISRHAWRGPGREIFGIPPEPTDPRLASPRPAELSGA